MQKLALNKSSLGKEKQRKASYERYLPSLEMKQKQLLQERKSAEQKLASHAAEMDKLYAFVKEHLPMLAVSNIKMEGLVSVTNYKLAEQNVLGTKLPTLAEVSFSHMEFGYLARPHWFDALAATLEKMMRLKLEKEVLDIRLKRLNKAVQTITQRVNLFSQVLIPEAQKNIKEIGLFLADQDRASVVRSKLAKQKHLDVPG